MRMRKKKHGAERIEACAELLIRDITTLKDGFDGLFDEERPVFLEIGCGKGNFAVGMAKKYPERVRVLPVRDEYELADVDTRETLVELLER